MMERLSQRIEPSRRRSFKSRFSTVAPLLLLLIASTVLSQFALTKVGVKYFAIMLGGAVAVTVLARISLRDLSIALALWMLSMSGFRTVGMVRMPGLPDFSFDRLLLAWIILMFLVRMILEGRRMKGPYWADILLIVHSVYVCVQLLVTAPVHFHSWVMSSLSPLFGFLYGKYVVSNEKEIRSILFFFLAITVYYYVTSIAEHFSWHNLVWPKVILDPTQGQLWHPGRSRGPVTHPPLFGQLLGMFMLVHLYLLTRPMKLHYRVMLMISFGLSLLGLFFAMTRGPWIATAAGILVMAALRPSYRTILIGMVVVALIGGVFGLHQLANSDFFQERINTMGTFDNRLSFLATSMRIIQDNPLFGVGYFRAKDFIWVYNQGVEIPFYGFVKKRSGLGMVPHDIYIGRTADEGLISAVLLAAFTFLIFRAFVIKWQANPRYAWFDRDFLGLVAGIMVCYLVGGLSIDYRYFDLVNVIFFFLAGLIYGYRNEELGLTGSQEIVYVEPDVRAGNPKC